MTELEFIQGDMWMSECDVLVNPVNCREVMGAGLAKKFKDCFPQYMFDEYKRYCRNGELKPGKKPRYWISPNTVHPNVCFFPTKDHWSEKSDLKMIRKSLEAMKQECGFEEMSIAFCALGCGLGGLNFNRDIKPLFEEILPTLPFARIEVWHD